MEIGPFRLVPNSDGKLRELEGAWNEYANVIFSACRLLSLSDALSTLALSLPNRAKFECNSVHEKPPAEQTQSFARHS